VEYLDSPWVIDGKFTREVAPATEHSLRWVVAGGPTQWPQVLETRIISGTARPFAIDTIELPTDNPWNALLFCSGHDFLADGSALVCTMQGDVWHVTGLDTGIDSPGIARWKRFAAGLQPLELKTAENLSYERKEIRVRAGQSIAFTLNNPDVVPHNWALAKPGSLQRVGELANKLIADPEAFARQYIPQSDDVLCYTDIVGPGQSQTIYFQAPTTPGRYPYLCTFPGHWMIMNGELIVE